MKNTLLIFLIFFIIIGITFTREYLASEGSANWIYSSVHIVGALTIVFLFKKITKKK